MSWIINFRAPGLKLHRALTSPVLKFLNTSIWGRVDLNRKGCLWSIRAKPRSWSTFLYLKLEASEIYKPRENRLIFEWQFWKKKNLSYREEHLFQVVLQVLSRPVRRPPRYIKIDRNVLERYRVNVKKISKKRKYKNWSTRVSRSFSFSSTVHVTAPDVEWGRTPPSSQVDVQRLTVES